MSKHSRRSFIAGSLASTLIPAALRKLRAAVEPVKITAVDIFPIRLTASKEEIDAGKMASYVVCRINTDVGVRGYSFAGPDPKTLPDVQKALVGYDLFNVEGHVQRGVDAWGGVEHAIWDAIGRIAGQPVYRLLGGERPSLRVYLTTVWPGNPDQSHVSYDAQAEMALREKKAGFKGMKIRAWRPNPLDDAEACRVIRQAVGPDFAIMFDRTAAAPESVGQKVWDYETGHRVASALEKHQAYWLEEPFARDDYESHAKLARNVGIRVTGGEGYRGTKNFRESLVARAYDTVQPDAVTAGGILLCRKISILAESFHVPTILHGSMGLRAAGFFQTSAAIGADWQELVFVTPPLLPEDLLSPGLQVMKTKTMYKFEDGHVHIPDLPGLGLDVDEDAIEKFRIKPAA